MTFSRTAPALLASAVLALAVVVPACASDDDLALTPSGSDAGTPETGASEDGGPPIVIDGGGPTSECGNRKVEEGEACDDGNTEGNDGCSADCSTVESAFEGDTCPGKSITLLQEGSALRASVTGTTKGAYNHGGTGCGGGSAPDVVYTFTPSSSGKAKVTLTADFQAMVAARTSCDELASEASCADILVERGGKTTMEVPVFGGTPVFLFVDGYAGSTGDFTLDVEVTNAVCGNGVGELPEECDDGNTVSGDGCSATCTFEGGGVVGDCPGQPFVLSGAAGAVRKVGFSGNTLTQGAPTLSAQGLYFEGSNNTVYALKSDIDGSAHVELTAGYAKASLYARSECSDGSSALGGTVLDSPGTGSIDFPVRAGQWFYVVVDGLRLGTRYLGGPYAVSVAVTPAACGNGVLDGNEECDDAKAPDAVGCSPTCKREPLAGNDTCPGHELVLAPQADGSETLVVSGTTAGLKNDVTSCQVLGPAGAGPDAVFRVTPTFTGRLSADVVGPFSSSVSVLRSCVIPPTDKDPPIGARDTVMACSQGLFTPADTSAASPYVLKGIGSVKKSAGAPVIAGQTYYVVVDGTGASGTISSGPFRLDLKLTKPVCGNGVIEGLETCDDGGTDGGDGCSATCELEPATTRETCGTAEAVTLVASADPAKPNTYEATVQSGTTNLVHNQNFNDTAAKAGACWARGADAYFKVVAPVGGVLRASAKSDAFDVILGFRGPTCPTGEQKDAPLSCTNAGPKGVTEELIRPINQGETILVVIDTPLPAVSLCADPISATYAADCALLHERGRFTLDLAITPSGCGDGFLVTTSGEECDDGNTANGDGCSSTCKSETLPNLDTCPGYPVALTASGNTRRGKVSVNTAVLTSNYSGACGGNAKDGVLRITPDMSGNLTARATGMAGVTLHARSVCSDASTEFPKASTSSCVNVVHDTVSFAVTKGQDYFVFVDGLDGAVGAPTIDILVTP